MKSRSGRRLLAFMLVAVAIAMIIAEPFPKTAALFKFTPTHGVDVGDLPAVAMLLIAALLAL